MFKTYEIKSGHWRALVSDELGANIVKLEYDGKDVFRPLESIEQLDINPYIQGAPLLLPANRTKDGKFTFEGKEYSLEITEQSTGANLHGLLHRQKFGVLEIKSDEIKLTYENKGEIYPFPFVIDVTYGFKGDIFTQKYEIKNTGDTNMPLTFALHTTFVEPQNFTVPIDACQQKNEKHIPTGEYVALNGQESCYVTGSPSKDLNISGYYRASGNEATVGDFIYRTDKNFDHWILFNGSGKKGLLCVEPQCGAVNGLNSQNGCIVLNPDQTICLKTEIEKGQS